MESNVLSEIDVIKFDFNNKRSIRNDKSFVESNDSRLRDEKSTVFHIIIAAQFATNGRLSKYDEQFKID